MCGSSLTFLHVETCLASCCFYFILCVFPACISMYHVGACYPQTPNLGIRYSGLESQMIMSHCVDFENCTWVLYFSTQRSSCWVISPFPQHHFLSRPCDFDRFSRNYMTATINIYFWVCYHIVLVHVLNRVVQKNRSDRMNTYIKMKFIKLIHRIWSKIM